MKTDEKLAKSQEEESAKIKENAQSEKVGKESVETRNKEARKEGTKTQDEGTGNEPAAAQQANSARGNEAPFIASVGLLLVVSVAGTLLLAALFSSLPNGSNNDDFEARITACEEACGLTKPKDGDAQKKSEATQAPESDATEAEKAAGKDPGKQKTAQARGDEAQKATASPSSPSPSPKAKTTKPEPVETLSPDQITYFCNILGIDRNGSKNPKKWDSPEYCSIYWYRSDASEYYDEWLAAAAHPRLSAELLHYLAYRCDSDYILEEEKAEKLAKLVLVHRNCDSDCIEYLSGSDYNAVREAVYEKLLD